MDFPILKPNPSQKIWDYQVGHNLVVVLDPSSSSRPGRTGTTLDPYGTTPYCRLLQIWKTPDGTWLVCKRPPPPGPTDGNKLQAGKFKEPHPEEDIGSIRWNIDRLLVKFGDQLSGIQKRALAVYKDYLLEPNMYPDFMVRLTKPGIICLKFFPVKGPCRDVLQMTTGAYLFPLFGAEGRITKGATTFEVTLVDASITSLALPCKWMDTEIPPYGQGIMDYQASETNPLFKELGDKPEEKTKGLQRSLSPGHALPPHNGPPRTGRVNLALDPTGARTMDFLERRFGACAPPGLLARWGDLLAAGRAGEFVAELPLGAFCSLEEVGLILRDGSV